MFIHLGEDIVISANDLVAILDQQILKSSSIVNEFLDSQKHHVVGLTSGVAKSVVITIDKIYYSPLASSTLKKRAQLISDVDTVFEEESIE